jgi:2-dehydropantoate 2-reductase
LKIAVMGAGAVGSYYGARLALAGHAVVLVARPQHVEAINRDGLVLETAAGTFVAAVTATTDPAGVAGADLVLFCVKSTDTLDAGRQIAPHLSPDCVIWSLQNGVDNAERLQALLGRPVTATVVHVAAGMTGPGHVKHHGRGELVIGPGPGNAERAAAFIAAEVPVTISKNVTEALWTKLGINCAFNALSAISQLPYGTMTEGEGVKEVMDYVIDECIAVAKAAGASLSPQIRSMVAALPGTMPGQYSSTAQDLARGKPTEIDHLNGYVARKGREFGIPTPANRTLQTLVKLLEARSGVGTGNAS